MTGIFLSKSVGIHDGTFHADEITACAMLILFGLIEKDKIIRSRDEDKLSRCEYVCDVGGIYDPNEKRFDHHQDSYNGPLSSAGMILHYLKDQSIIEEDLFNYLSRALIQGVDEIDTGQFEPPLGLCTYSQVISSFMPCSYMADPQEIEMGFYAALEFSIDLLKRLIKKYDYIMSCSSFVKSAMEEGKDYLVFNEPMPWLESFFQLGGEDHKALFLIMPTGSHWKLRGIPPSLDHRMQVRKPLPENWAGLLNDELKKASGIEGAIFCHKGRFISVWETKEDALKALKIALES